jgi:2-polyprenyl-3-methyl-5-hydroxy-6-metoxy-1,4-benzoquinol methylase
MMSSTMDGASARATDERAYAERLLRLQRAPWKRWLQVQAPFRWNLRRLHPGATLEVGCGIGRNLQHLDAGSVGIDTNVHCVAAAREIGCVAFTPDHFRASPDHRPGRFDTLLLAHVVEHMTEPEAVALIREYEAFVRPGGRLLLIAPQEAGFASDATHVTMMSFDRLRTIAAAAGFTPGAQYSFPFPRWAGPFFTYNEFVLVSAKPPHAAHSR